MSDCNNFLTVFFCMEQTFTKPQYLFRNSNTYLSMPASPVLNPHATAQWYTSPVFWACLWRWKIANNDQGPNEQPFSVQFRSYEDGIKSNATGLLSRLLLAGRQNTRITCALHSHIFQSMYWSTT